MSYEIWYVSRADLSKPGDAPALHSRADVKSFNKHGLKTTLITCCSDSLIYKKKDNERIIQHMNNPFNRILFELKLMTLLLFSRKKMDFIFFRGPTNLMLVGILLKILNIPFGLELNGVFSYRHKKTTFFKDFIEKTSDKFFMRHSKLIVGVTEELTAQALKECNDSAIVITSRNGIDIEEIKPVFCCTDKDVFKIGFLGKAYNSRGLEEAIASIKILVDENINAALKIVGGGPGIPKLKKLSESLNVDKYVEFVNAVPPEEMATQVADCDLMWASYEQDPELSLCGLSPLKLWTYLALEKPVLVRDPGVLHHYHNVPGLLWTVARNEQELATDIKKIIEKKQDLKKIGKDGRVYLINNVSWSNHAEPIVYAIRKILSRGRAF